MELSVVTLNILIKQVRSIIVRIFVYYVEYIIQVLGPSNIIDGLWCDENKNIDVNIQYTYIIGKYKIHLYKL